MSEHVLTIIKPGPLCTVQDSGRPGFQRFGVSTSGAVDQSSLLLGNKLLGNDPDAPALEITFGGFQAGFAARTAFALTGGDLTATLNGTEVSRYTVLRTGHGDQLAMELPRSGLRAYLCIAGGFDLPRVLGSAATYMPGKLGGLSGRALKAGDKLDSSQLADVVALPESGVILDSIAHHDYPLDRTGHILVRVIPGPQEEGFTEQGIDTFFGSEYIVSDRSDRQGIRFDGPEIEAGPGGYDIVSDAIATGSVQIPGNRMPIALLADRQTTGGYPKIGVVATADLPLLAQAAPGTRVRFARTGVDEAIEALRARAQEIESAIPLPPQLDTISVAIHGDSYEVALPRKSGGAGEGGPSLMQVEVNGTLYTVSIREDA